MIYIQVYKSAKASGAPLDFVDSCSLLMRLDMEGMYRMSRHGRYVP